MLHKSLIKLWWHLLFTTKTTQDRKKLTVYENHTKSLIWTTSLCPLMQAFVKRVCPLLSLAFESMFKKMRHFGDFQPPWSYSKKEMQFSAPFISNTAAIIMIWCLAILLPFAGHFLSFECILTPLLLLLPFWVSRGFHPQFIFPSLAFPDRLFSMLHGWEITLSHFFMCLHICNHKAIAAKMSMTPRGRLLHKKQ